MAARQHKVMEATAPYSRERLELLVIGPMCSLSSSLRLFRKSRSCFRSRRSLWLPEKVPADLAVWHRATALPPHFRDVIVLRSSRTEHNCAVPVGRQSRRRCGYEVNEYSKKDYADGLRETVQTLMKSIPGYRCFIAEYKVNEDQTTAHTALGYSERFYKKQKRGLLFQNGSRQQLTVVRSKTQGCLYWNDLGECL